MCFTSGSMQIWKEKHSVVGFAEATEAGQETPYLDFKALT